MTIMRSEGRRVDLDSADARLHAYVQRVWLPDDRADSPVAVTLESAPEGHVIAEQYAVLPHPRAPRFLVPLESRAVAAASFRGYSASRARVSRMLRNTVGTGFATGIAQRMLRHRLVVSVDRRFPRDRWADVLVVQHLAEVLGRPGIRALVAVRRINPSAKPTLQLFDEDGAPAGYAKLGPTEPTRLLVRTEAAAMAALGGRLDKVIVPELLASGDWGETAYAVGAPLPSGIRRWHEGPDATAPALAEVARSTETSRGPLAGSPFAARLRSDLAAVSAGDDVAPVLAAWLARLECDPAPMEYGRMHGDWIANNLGRLGDRVAVWDWEHSVDDAPVGFDLLHWRFHRALDRDGLPAAVRAVDAATGSLGLLDVPEGSRRLVASTYLLDMFIRWTRLAAGSGAWNPKWYPGLLPVARERDRDR